MRLKFWARIEPAADRSPVDADLARLYQDEAPRMRRWLRARFSKEKSADIVQSTFERMVPIDPERFPTPAHRRGYLYRVASNIAKDHFKSAAFRMEVPPSGEGSSSEEPFAALEARDLLRRIELAIPKLPVRTREVFMAHRFENLTYRQIADRHGIDIKTVEYHIAAALRDLHRAVGNRP